MRAYSLKKVKEMVSSYNDTKSANKVAEQLGLPARDVKYILVWLHKHDPNNNKADQGRSFLLRLPTNPIWAQFLYLHDVAAHTAAACLNWPLERLLETCGGPKEWAKREERRPIRLHENDIWHGRENQNRRADDPDADEIETRKREIHAMWEAGDGSMRGGAPKDRRYVEVREYVYDNRDGTFK